MGTRALITIDEKPYIAIHWDGHPDSLGANLFGTVTKTEIIIAAEKHTIDFAAPDVRKYANKKRYSEIAAKTDGKYSAADIAKLDKQGRQLRFGIHSAGDSVVGHIEQYGDWAEYQYDLSNGKWRYRALSGCYPGSMDGAGPLKTLTKKACKIR